MSTSPLAMRTLPNSSLSVAKFMKHQTIFSSVSVCPSQLSLSSNFRAMKGTAPVVMIALACSRFPAEIFTRTQVEFSCLLVDIRSMPNLYILITDFEEIYNLRSKL